MPIFEERTTYFWRYLLDDDENWSQWYECTRDAYLSHSEDPRCEVRVQKVREPFR